MKTAILITARLKSTRLPLKVLKPIHGRPMIGHMLDRLKHARIPEQIIICTSTVAQDDPLEDVARQEGVECFRGHPEDVLLRITEAAEAHGVDTIVSCTADNPFVDPGYVDQLVEFHLQHNNDLSKVEGLPFGTFSYVLSRPAMRRACTIKAETDTEVWGGYFTETGLFKVGVQPVTDPKVRRPEIRLTVDTPEDFQLVSAIFDELFKEGRVFSLREIIELYDRRADLRFINHQVIQKPGRPVRVDLT